MNAAKAVKSHTGALKLVPSCSTSASWLFCIQIRTTVRNVDATPPYRQKLGSMGNVSQRKPAMVTY